MDIIENIPRLKPRDSQAHKGDFGRVAIIGGSIGMSGAAAIAGRAALRAGARGALPGVKKLFGGSGDTPLTMGQALRKNLPNFGHAVKETGADWYMRGVLGPLFSGLTAYELINNPGNAGSLLGGVGGGIAGSALMRGSRLLPNIGVSIAGGMLGSHLGEKVLPSTTSPRMQSPHDPYRHGADSRTYRL